MNWMELSIVVNHEVEYDVTEILESYGSNGVVIEDSNILEEQPVDKFGEIYDLNPEDYPEKGVRLKAYFNEFTYNENLKSNINYEILSLQQIDKTIYDYQEKLIAEVDWENEWKNYFHPFRASKQFTIVPSWMCLKAIETFVKPTDSVIDVGTGSGILSIASHLLGVQRIKALDIDEMAVNVAKENFKKNHCDDAIEAVPGNLLKNENEKFNIVIANILAHIIEEMIEDTYNTLIEDGYFITSGIIEEKYQDIESQMKRIGFKIISVEHDNGWVCIVGQKVSG
ncbi:MAG: 50S ribosomal protein L11 methyltransferase [Staphylococcus epidermidis]|nr:50S ribosomal protein L11 methyltransferase [Staphylococcus epidermidis]